MRRGLKDPGRRFPLLDPENSSIFPDEEGTESKEAPWEVGQEYYYSSIFPDEEGTERSGSSPSRSWRSRTAASSPMRRGLKDQILTKRPRRAATAASSPMRRGLKAVVTPSSTRGTRDSSIFPDEEGTESSLPGLLVRPGPTAASSPMRRGLKGHWVARHRRLRDGQQHLPR